TALEITSDSKSEYDNQDPLPPLLKLLRAEPIGTSNDVIALADFMQTLVISKKTKQVTNKVSSVNVIKKKTQTMSPSVLDPCLDKKANSSTEQLLLTLMEEVKDELLELSIFNDHLVYHKPADSELVDESQPTENHPDVFEPQNISISEAEPSPTIISPSAKIV
nr:hypothetical protein [Tanacetum cinerariifolium]